MSDFKEWRLASGYTYDKRQEQAWQAATRAERERCAKLVEEWPGVMQYEEGCFCADIDELAEGIRSLE